MPFQAISPKASELEAGDRPLKNGVHPLLAAGQWLADLDWHRIRPKNHREGDVKNSETEKSHNRTL
jgi:hypothetical protein